MPRGPAFDRDEIIERARRLFWERGWAATSMKDLERELNLRPGSFYAAFGSKEALYGLALESYARQGAERLADLRATHDPLSALKAHLRAVVSDPEVGARACMLAKTLLELQPRRHPLAEQAGAHLAGAEAGFAALFTAAREIGQIDARHDPARLARRFQSDLLGLRVSAERTDIDAGALADEIAADLDRLAA